MDINYFKLMNCIFFNCIIFYTYHLCILFSENKNKTSVEITSRASFTINANGFRKRFIN